MNLYFAESHLADWSTFGQAVLALVTVGYTWVEYGNHKRSARAELAQDRTSKLDDDEVAQFAVTSLDWGAGLMIVPTAWVGAVRNAAIPYDFEDISDALRPGLSSTTLNNPVRLLYRNAFNRLFSHFEGLALLAGKDPALVNELGGIGWIANRLMVPLYGDDPKLYVSVIKSWYRPEVLIFIEMVAKQFPERPCSDIPSSPRYSPDGPS